MLPHTRDALSQDLKCSAEKRFSRSGKSERFFFKIGKKCFFYEGRNKNNVIRPINTLKAGRNIWGRCDLNDVFPWIMKTE